MNLPGPEDVLDARFPGWRDCDRVTVSGIEAAVWEHNHEVSRHPCYAYGKKIGEDVSHSFDTTLILLPKEEAEDPVFLLIQICGHSTYSERYDQDSTTVSCETAEGDSWRLRTDGYYEKYGGRKTDEWDNLEKTRELLEKNIGVSLSRDELGGFVRSLARKYSY